MALRRNVVLRFFVLGVCSLVLVGIAAAALPLVKEWWLGVSLAAFNHRDEAAKKPAPEARRRKGAKLR